MRILLVLTGGTISTVVENNVMGIRGDSPYLIVEKYREQRGEEGIPEFDVIEPVRMLSECNQPVYLERIYYGILEKLGIGKDDREVREYWEKEEDRDVKGWRSLYDGIILTHGSDTLSYSAAFFAAVFSWISVPFVLTAADYPISDPASNGRKNFSDAVDFIRKMALPGVFVVWQNRIPGANLYRASEILEADTFRDCFSSFTGQVFGEIKDGNVTVFRGSLGNAEGYSVKNRGDKKRNCMESGENRIGDIVGEPAGNFHRRVLDLHMKYDVLFLRPYPGLRYDLISLENKKIKAVVHYLYHSATACTQQAEDMEERKYNILAFAKYCKELAIDFYLAGFKSENQHLYETNELLLKGGFGKPLYLVSPETAYMKVLAAYNQTAVSVEKFLRREL